MKSFSAVRWQQIEALFDEALDLDAEARRVLLDRACADDPDLRREVKSLLQADAASPAFLNAAAADYAAPMLPDLLDELDGEQMGRSVGAYRLVRKIGHGGMGRVFLAERADGQFEQQVALKLIRAELTSEALRRRFLQERQILARLQHPGIARLLDGGTTDAGQPFLVIDYVKGQPIHTYCDTQKLSITARLQLFGKVCEAVQYAHNNLVVHRDLKPSNILVTDTGQVKLLDFGIAKLLEGDDEEALTRTGLPAMTPEYAAPEQVRRGSITTATDVYSLGVILYELLSGHRPYQVKALSPADVERVICKTEPPRPSTAASQTEELASHDGEPRIVTPEIVSRVRSTQPERLQRRLIGDLDMIVVKALAKEPERRYATAAQLGQDLKRHLAGLPVEARGDTLGYRLRKFVRRHRWGVAVAAAFVVLLTGYAVTVTVQSRKVKQALAQARLEADKSAEVTRFMMGLFESNDPSESLGDTLNVRDVLARGVERIESLDQQPEVQGQMLDVVGQVYQSLGEYDTAQALLEQAVAKRRTLLGEEHLDVAQSLYNLGAVLLDRGDYEMAEPLLREALTMRQKLLGEEHPDVASSLNKLGMLEDDTGDYDAAEQLYREALAMRQKLLGEEHPDVASSLNNLGLLLMQKGQYDQAETIHRKALEMRQRIASQQGREEADLDVTYSLNNLALVLNLKGDHDASEQFYRELIEMDRKLLGEEHPDFAIDLNNLGGLLADKGDYDAAGSLYRQALAIYMKTLGPSHPRIAQSLNNLASALRDQGIYNQAEQHYREALAMRRTLLGPEHPDVASSLNNLGTVFSDQGRYDEAESYFREALAMRRKLLDEEHPDVTQSLHSLAVVLDRQGNHAAAEPLYQEAIRRHAAARGDTHWVTAYFKSGLGACFTAQARYEEAEPLLLDALALLQSERGAENKYTQGTLERLVALYEAWGRPAEATTYRALLITS
jgi:serine/threonine-protein kinase